MAALLANGSEANANKDACRWPEFTHSMCSTLNREQCLVVAAPQETAVCICRRVDAVLDKPLLTGDNGDQEGSSLVALQNAPRVCFTTEESIAKLQKCTAVYGRVPMLAVLHMCNDCSFVLDFDSNLTTSKEIETFLLGVTCNRVAKALQGAAPPRDDCFEPCHNITLKHGLCAVTSTIARLKQKEPGGALSVFWSDRCAMCPTVLQMLDCLVGIVWDVAKRHGVTRTFSYILCNIDDNELPEDDWPEPQQQVVPTIVAYNKRGDRFVYEGSRTIPRLALFLCKHCLPQELTDVTQITSDVILCAEEARLEELLGEKNGTPDTHNDIKDKSCKDSTRLAGHKRTRCDSSADACQEIGQGEG